MAKSRNDAYAGVAEMPNERHVVVAYYDKTRLRECFGYQPPGHPNRRRIGWYWHHEHAEDACKASETFGPFTSSRKALMDALAKNPAPEAAHG